MEVQVNTRLVEMLSADYQISGSLEIRGENPAVYINNPSYPVFALRDATVTPLMPGTQIGAMSVPRLFVHRDELQVILIDMPVAEAQLPPTRRNLVCFTDTFVVRGGFASGQETQAVNLFTAGQGPFFPAVEAEVVALRPLMEEIGGQADLVFLRGDAVRTFYSTDGE
jgi:hypothetical protein